MTLTRRLLTLTLMTCLSFLFMFSSTGWAQDDNVSIIDAKHTIVALQHTAAEHIITQEQAQQGIQLYLKKASDTAHRPLTLQEVLATPEPAAPQLSNLQKIAGLATFMNVLMVFATFAGVVAFGFLFGSYVKSLMQIFKSVPYVVYEISFYFLSICVLIGGLANHSAIRPFIGLTGCLLFLAAQWFTSRIRKLKLDEFIIPAILCLVATAAALLYASSLIGFIAVAALLWALGFSIFISPLCYGFGFKDESSLGRATTAAFILLAAAVGIHITGAAEHIHVLNYFQPGALFLGCFVFFTGMLIASTRWADGRNRNWAIFQVMYLAACFFGVYIGAVFGMGVLLKFAVTFGVMWALAKIFEIPAESARGYAFVTLMGCGAVFVAYAFFNAHPELMHYLLLTR